MWVLINCRLQKHENCPQMPDEMTLSFQKGHMCRFVSLSLHWLEINNQHNDVNFFNNLIEENVDSNLQLLEQYGISSEDLIQLSALDYEASTSENQYRNLVEKTNRIYEMLQRDNEPIWSVLSLMASLTAYKLPEKILKSVARDYSAPEKRVENIDTHESRTPNTRESRTQNTHEKVSQYTTILQKLPFITNTPMLL
jgi:hypothetical protein